MPPLSRLTNEEKPVNIGLSPRHGQSSPWRGGRKLRGLFQPGFSIWKLAILRHLRPLTPRALRKPSVYAGKNVPTAVYDAASSHVCQSKNRDLFCFWRVFPRFGPISQVFLRFQRAFPTGSKPKSGRRLCCALCHAFAKKLMSQGWRTGWPRG